MGRDWLAFAKRYIEMARVTRVNRLGSSLVKPSVYLRPMAQQTSNSPAIMRIIQEVVTDIPLTQMRFIFRKFNFKNSSGLNITFNLNTSPMGLGHTSYQG